VATFLVILLTGLGFKLQLPALDDLDSLGGLVVGALGDVLNLLNDIVALKDLAENDVATIKPAAPVVSNIVVNGSELGRHTK
jgi:hypothetical protein